MASTLAAVTLARRGQRDGMDERRMLAVRLGGGGDAGTRGTGGAIGRQRCGVTGWLLGTGGRACDDGGDVAVAWLW